MTCRRERAWAARRFLSWREGAMKLIISLIIALVVLFLGYFGYKYFTAPEGQKPTLTGTFTDLKDSAIEGFENAHLSKGLSLYKVAKTREQYEAALAEFEAALKDEKISDKDRAEAMRFIGLSYFKIWEWSKQTDTEAGKKSVRAFERLLEKYPDERPKVERPLNRLKVSLGM
jgi:hypothetical protein